MEAVSTVNLDAYATLWKHDPKASFYFFSPYFTESKKGWDSIFASTSRDWKANPSPQFSNMHVENLATWVTGEMALAEYDMVGTPVHYKADVFPYIADRRFHLFTTMVKEGGKWKIIAQAMTMPDAYNKKEYKMEMDMTITAYNLMATGKKKEALELFKLTAELFPDSYNTHDSLAEAYEQMGNTQLAIAHYEKSVKLNPANKGGIAALQRLKGN